MKLVIPGRRVAASPQSSNFRHRLLDSGLSAHASRLLPTCALKVLISGKPEISGPRPGMTRHMIRISKSPPASAQARRSITPDASYLPFHHHAFDLGNGLGRIEMLRTCLRAIHDGVTAVETEGVFEIIEALAGCFIAAVLQPTIGLQERSRSEKALAVPPIA